MRTWSLFVGLLLVLQVAGKNYYRILKLDKKASTDDVKKAFRAEAKKYHPDKNPNPKAKKRFMEIKEAYETLKSPKSRAEYDAGQLFGGLGGIPMPPNMHPDHPIFKFVKMSQFQEGGSVPGGGQFQRYNFEDFFAGPVITPDELSQVGELFGEFMGHTMNEFKFFGDQFFKRVGAQKERRKAQQQARRKQSHGRGIPLRNGGGIPLGNVGGIPLRNRPSGPTRGKPFIFF